MILRERERERSYAFNEVVNEKGGKKKTNKMVGFI